MKCLAVDSRTCQGISVLALLRLSVHTKNLKKDGFIYTLPGRGCYVASKNVELLREENLRKIEEHIDEVVRLAASCNLSKQDIIEKWLIVQFGRNKYECTPEIKNLTKSYPGFTLDNLNLTLPSGCIMGLIGEKRRRERAPQSNLFSI